MGAVIDPTTSAHKIAEYVDRHRDACLDVVRELLTAAARGDRAVQECVAGRLEALGCAVDIIGHGPGACVGGEFSEPEAPAPSELVSVVGTHRGRSDGHSGARSLALFAHADIEPPPQDAGTAVFEPRIAGGRLYGWGVADDLSGVGMMLAALQAMRGAGAPPAGTVHIVSTVSKHRARGMAAVIDRGYRADAAVYVHPAESGFGLEDIKAATPGLLRFGITVAGGEPPTREPAHTPVRHRGVDAVDGAMRVIEALRALDERRGRTVRHAAIEAAAGRATNLLIAHVRGGDPQRLHRMADQCVVAGSVSMPPGEAVSEVQAQITAAIAEATRDHPSLAQHQPEIRWLEGTPGGEVPLDHPLYDALRRAIEAVTGQTPRPNVLHASSDIRHPILRGIPCVGFGSLAGGLAQAGGRDEWIDVDDYLRGVHVAARLIGDWCGYGV
jgi:acetylornithine deacetylase